MNLLRRLLPGIALVAGTFLFSVGLQALAAWTGPTATAPGADAYAPLNTGPTAQTKSGSLNVTGGNVGIGTASPATKLVVSNNGTQGLEFNPIGASGENAAYLQSYNRGTSNYAPLAYIANDHEFWTPSGGYSTLYISSGGNVGIGTTNPGYKLDVAGDVNITGCFRVNGGACISGGGGGTVGGSGGVNYLAKWTSGNSLANSQVYDNGTNVGIGTASPGEKLDVNGNIVFNSVLRTPWRMHLYGTELLYLLNTAGVIVSKAWGGNGNLTVEGSLCLGGVCQSSWPSVGGGQWQTNGSSLYYNGGNVGIGTNNPLKSLHIVGSGLASRNFYVQSPLNPGTIVGLGELQSAMQDWPGYTIYGIGWDSASGGIGALMPPSRTFGIYGNGGPANFLVTGNTTLVGNVGIGSGMSSPWAQLDVGGGVGLNIPAFRAMDNSFSKYIFIVPYLGTGGYSGVSQSGDSGIFSAQNTGLVISPWNASGIRISPSGDVNVGAGVFVNSGGYAHFNSTLDAQDYWIRAIGRWASSLSDVRLKKDIQPLTNVLDKLSSVHGVSFNWNEAYTALGHPNDKRQIGVIAQELETQFPELVTASSANGYKSVNYEGLTAVLVEAVKEQQKEIDSLKARLDALEKK